MSKVITQFMNGATALLVNSVMTADTVTGDVTIVKGDLIAGNDTFVIKNATGYVGVGTINPISELDVNGELSIKSGSSFNKAMSGDLLLACSPVTAGSSAATLNAAAAGTITATLTLTLQDAAAALHKWSSNTLATASAVAAVDTDIVAPAVSDITPNLTDGTVDITVTYDTDAGATKTYTAGDVITVTISSAAILGYSIADATFTDTIVA